MPKRLYEILFPHGTNAVRPDDITTITLGKFVTALVIGGVGLFALLFIQGWTW